jgi:hypothetical protein
MAHPFQAWLTDHSVSYDEAAKRCKKLGTKTSPDYLEQFARGYYCPSHRFSLFIATKLCKGAISVEAIANFKYSIRPCTWADLVAA